MLFFSVTKEGVQPWKPEHEELAPTKAAVDTSRKSYADEEGKEEEKNKTSNNGFHEETSSGGPKRL